MRKEKYYYYWGWNKEGARMKNCKICRIEGVLVKNINYLAPNTEVEVVVRLKIGLKVMKMYQNVR